MSRQNSKGFTIQVPTPIGRGLRLHFRLLTQCQLPRLELPTVKRLNPKMGTHRAVLSPANEGC